jgi:hypothetical protein
VVGGLLTSAASLRIARRTQPALAADPGPEAPTIAVAD